MGRRGEHGLLPEEAMGHGEWMSQRASEGVQQGLGEEGRKEAVGPLHALPPTPVDTHQDPGVQEEYSVSWESDWVPPATKSLPETSLALGEGLTHHSLRGDESRRIIATEELCALSALPSSIWKGWEGNEEIFFFLDSAFGFEIKNLKEIKVLKEWTVWLGHQGLSVAGIYQVVQKHWIF